MAVREATVDQRFAEFAAKMESAQLPELVIRIFRHYYDQLLAGATGLVPGNVAGPVQSIQEYDDLHSHYANIGRQVLDKALVLKLNGGLGTSMGMSGPKSLIEVKDGLSFLDITIRQVLDARRRTGARLPLVLMNSFSTHDATVEALQTVPEFAQDIPIDFLQHKKPRIWRDTLSPVTWPADPSREWCPPGHGDIYVALLTSGLLPKILDAGYEYAFVSNSDNLGAVLDEEILGYMAAEQISFLMEVAHRTLADSKGGHLARRPDGQLILRELAQCPPDEMDAFQDIELYRFFNTNNIWLHLPTLYQVMRTHNDMLELPLIRNEKPIDSTNPQSPRVYQLETAMGSAIALFPDAQALCVPRIRFIPVKRNTDLLILRSDVYRLTQEHRLELAPERHAGPPRRPPLVFLDERYYQFIEDFNARFARGAPSLVQAIALHVEGDVYFGAGVVIEGEVHIINRGQRPMLIPDGAHLANTVYTA